jgi:group II intron reverse transcriptase/maturase
MEMSYKMNKSVEWFKDYSTYLIIVRREGPQPVLKRTMRSLVTAVHNCWTKICLIVIGYLRMRLNYQNSSYFGHDSAGLWVLLLHKSLGNLKVKIYFKGYSNTKALLIVFGTDNKKVSLIIKLVINLINNSRVINAIGEVFLNLDLNKAKQSEDGRGYVVPVVITGKGAKHVYKPSGVQYRSYTTRCEKNKLVPVSEQPIIIALSKDYEILAKHWYVCYQNPNRQFADLRGLLKLDSIWFAAYIKLVKNKGSQTPGPDYHIINSLTKQKILELKTAVLSKSFTWIGVRQLMIPKPFVTGKLRPLGIPAINDRLVQEVLRSIIEPIFELDFSNNSYGFRPNRSCHLCLKHINTRMKDSIWYIEGDIKSYFDNIDHSILISLITKRVKDPLIINLIKSGLKARVFTQFNRTYTPEIGTPQAEILSPLLSNIYLHELDLFMVKISEEYQGHIKPIQRKRNPLQIKLLRSSRKSEYYNLRIPSRISNEVGYRNCKYIRYADDFLVGVIGPREIAIEIRTKIEKFLKEELKIILSVEKTKVTHISKGIPFLGYLFSRRSIIIRQRYSGTYYNRKMTIPTLDVNIKKVISRLAEAGFCDKDGSPTPAFRFLRLPQSEINTKVNNILRELSEWCSIAGNRKRAIAYVAYIIRYSIAKVYAAKFKMKTVARVFKIGRNNLSKPLGTRAKSVIGVDEESTPHNGKSLKGLLFDRYHKIPEPKGNKLKPNWKPEYLKLLEKGEDFKSFMNILWKQNIVASSENPLIQMGWRLQNTISSQGHGCAICGSQNQVDMHHVRALKDIDKYKSKVHQFMIAIQRIQIPLCKLHHLEIHRGKWNNKPMKPSSVGEPRDG